MTKQSINTRTAYLLMALTGTAMIMVPLITGAAPSTNPPNGPVVPNFSGLKIINPAAQTTLDVTADGQISGPGFWQPPASDTDMAPHKMKCEFTDKGVFDIPARKCNLPVSITDTEGLKVSGKTNVSALAASGNIYSAANISAAGTISAQGIGRYYYVDGETFSVPASSYFDHGERVYCDSPNHRAVSCNLISSWGGLVADFRATSSMDQCYAATGFNHFSLAKTTHIQAICYDPSGTW